MIKVNEGEIIPLFLQHHAGRADLEVTCVLTIISENKEYMRVKMQHLSAGLYVNNSVEMPNLGILAAQYFMNDEDSFSSVDTYEPIPKPQEPEKMIVGEVISKTKSNDIIQGVVVKSEKKVPDFKRI